MAGEKQHSETKEERRRRAGHPETHPEVLEQLAHDEEKEVRLEVALNLKTPVSVLENWQRIKTRRSVGRWLETPTPLSPF